jgi:hypothetical protein
LVLNIKGKINKIAIISLSCLNHYNIHIFFGIKKDQKTCIIFLNKNNCEQEQKGIKTWIFFFINSSVGVILDKKYTGVPSNYM